MKSLLYPSASRGHNNFGWLDSYHSFSFGRYFNQERMNFGKLRVLNDDLVSGGAGFGTHPHDNMEIVSIPLKGAIEHKDSTGTKGIIHTGDVQIMSAGSGLTHSEYNHSKKEVLNFLQLWVIPKEMNIKPRYEQKMFTIEKTPNHWHTVVAPDREEALWINQDAYFSLLKTDQDSSVKYTLNEPAHGVYFFVIEGKAASQDFSLNRRDAAAVFETDSVILDISTGSYLLAVEVPLN